ncbi:hypothetical protein BJ508DRAFT_332070 [Ascobolus immersus RN42]|uniref:Uncharacterized protein n=1 Tax=Ascobolus immersus RN42 TaxID=1160509 RepID=A0A3N4HUE8_ASCIM|nr:hypothetical protein BJ508DRAFT_332070 [Ascobolus immersus RN42]
MATPISIPQSTVLQNKRKASASPPRQEKMKPGPNAVRGYFIRITRTNSKHEHEQYIPKYIRYANIHHITQLLVNTIEENPEIWWEDGDNNDVVLREGGGICSYPQDPLDVPATNQVQEDITVFAQGGRVLTRKITVAFEMMNPNDPLLNKAVVAKPDRRIRKPPVVPNRPGALISGTSEIERRFLVQPVPQPTATPTGPTTAPLGPTTTATPAPTAKPPAQKPLPSFFPGQYPSSQGKTPTSKPDDKAVRIKNDAQEQAYRAVVAIRKNFAMLTTQLCNDAGIAKPTLSDEFQKLEKDLRKSLGKTDDDEDADAVDED